MYTWLLTRKERVIWKPEPKHAAKFLKNTGKKDKPDTDVGRLVLRLKKAGVGMFESIAAS